MSYAIIWYDEALEDLELIYNFYLIKNPGAAIKIYNNIVQEVKRLKDFPDIAALEPLLEDKELSFRSLVIKDGLFEVIYHVDPDDQTVIIVRVWCCRRDPKELELI